jgi:hypothetical protein
MRVALTEQIDLFNLRHTSAAAPHGPHPLQPNSTTGWHCTTCCCISLRHGVLSSRWEALHTSHHITSHHSTPQRPMQCKAAYAVQQETLLSCSAIRCCCCQYRRPPSQSCDCVTHLPKLCK